MANLSVKFITAIADLGHSGWQRIAGADYPFTRYEFLHALETAHSKDHNTQQPDVACNRQSGWAPQHAVISDGDNVLALMPQYLKYHSYGEYIFDWAWAEAYQRNGLNYYPKLLAAIPYSPVTGPRLLLDHAALRSRDIEQDKLIQFLAGSLRQQCAALGASSFHLLYPDAKLNRAFAGENFIARHSFQYHWFNRASHDDRCTKFASFDEFLATLKARKRKAIAKERREVMQQGIRIERLVGEQIEPGIWQRFFHFYQLTYAKRSGHGGYLSQAFFEALGRDMGAQVMLVVALQGNEIIAAALNLFSSTTLYGRYWGCNRDAEFLHFEACYYQGIEFCIERGLERFDAGAQGEHKIQRGFRPVSTWSNHYIEHEGFRDAITRYIAEEREANLRYMQQAEQLLPFRVQPPGTTSEACTTGEAS